jgi:hypothetical protein
VKAHLTNIKSEPQITFSLHFISTNKKPETETGVSIVFLPQGLKLFLDFHPILPSVAFDVRIVDPVSHLAAHARRVPLLRRN